ncbi:Nectin-4 [Anabarilius grahami]|uniref:Nectin-4 n=1 Tax=Anabarilius grahami TaxID=495550 RepID=A0A3N0Z7V4_ANAGA|nr:Nectin-4 [Anabarilius grahami]
MEFLMTEATYKLITVLCMIRGTYGVLIHHNVFVTAVEGQNISLPCYVGEENEIAVIQLEWIKQQKGNEKIDQKIVVFHPSMETFYFQSGPLLKKMTSSKTGKLQGSILTLYEVTMKDSGNYICEITSYPNGSIKRTTKLQVTEAPASVKMSHPYRFIKEGDEVKITCSASPPPLRYKLRRSKDKLFWIDSLNGEFTLPNVTRNNSDLYVCLPEWKSVVQNQQGLNTTMELTVNFLDDIKCDTSSPLNVSFGEDVEISCIAKASQHLQYKWMRGDTTVSLSDTLSLTSMTSNQSGTYKLTAVFQNNQLQRDVEFSIHVLSKQSEERTTKNLRNFTSMGMSSWNTGAIETTTESGHFLTSTSKPNATMTNLQPRNTSNHTPLTGSSSAPPVGNASTLHATTVKSTGTSCTENPSTSPDPVTGRKIVTSVLTKKNTTTTVTSSKESKSTAYIAVPIVLLFLVLTALLYKRYQNQKKFEDDEMERQENPIYGNICIDGGGAFEMSPEVCYEQMSQASTLKQGLKVQQGDVSYASLDLTVNKKRKKKRKYQKQPQAHQAQTHPQPASQQNCMDQDDEADVTLPSRSSSLMVSRHSIYLNSHQVALEAEERERERERERMMEMERDDNAEREFDMRRNLHEGYDHSLGRSRQSLEQDS